MFNQKKYRLESNYLRDHIEQLKFQV